MWSAKPSAARGESPLKGLFADGRHTLFKALPDDAHAAVSAALAKAGVGGERLDIRADGAEVLDFRVFARTDRAGHPYWGVMPVGRRRAVTFRFPRKGFVYELVNGKAYGAVGELTLTVGSGTPLAFEQLPEATGLASVSAAGNAVTVRTKGSADSVVRVRVFKISVSQFWKDFFHNAVDLFELFNGRQIVKPFGQFNSL